jgi:hypothetical protein
MVFLTSAECTSWCGLNRVDVPLGAALGHDGPRVHVELTSSESRLYAASCQLENSVGPWHTCLLWVFDHDIWRSSTNLHLYYRLRESYSDHRLLSQAPGHLFLNYERDDLITFIEIGLLSGWDMHVLSDLGYGRVFTSHESWAEITRSNEKELEEVAAGFQRGKWAAQVNRGRRSDAL